MGSIEGHEGSWAYVKGGMGSISNALAKLAKEKGVDIFTDSSVEKILIEKDHNNDEYQTYGVELQNGEQVTSKVVLSNVSPHHTFI